jgi:hypothetical protein
MKMSQGNFLCSYLKQTKMSFFYFTKSENRFCRGGEGLVPVGQGGCGEEVNMVQILYTCMQLEK